MVIRVMNVWLMKTKRKRRRRKKRSMVVAAVVVVAVVMMLLVVIIIAWSRSEYDFACFPYYLNYAFLMSALPRHST